MSDLLPVRMQDFLHRCKSEVRKSVSGAVFGIVCEMTDGFRVSGSAGVLCLPDTGLHRAQPLTEN